MSGVKDISRDLGKLEAQLENLEESLGPLLGNVDEMASQLPLLDKAKLFSLIAYSIESLLFSSLRLQGTDAQNHAVFTELKRVQQYFAKIKAAEEPEVQRTMTVNKEAAARVLKADLSDNKTISSKLAEKIAEERAKALLKSVETKKRPAETGSPAPAKGSSGEEPERKKKKPKHKGKKRA
ncbi:Sas10/Utp3/C1D family protein [Stachybotrys elegans]|uniref:Exosome complex protein n=1 Tax=Stachybotrys elegans TaxID=80388 RepID=A0A8K0SKQ8_9HYPO|nr:Sas10/Utp3/C1D family protein [Stachybotrys elegans]